MIARHKSGIATTAVAHAARADIMPPRGACSAARLLNCRIPKAPARCRPQRRLTQAGPGKGQQHAFAFFRVGTTGRTSRQAVNAKHTCRSGQPFVGTLDFGCDVSCWKNGAHSLAASWTALCAARECAAYLKPCSPPRQTAASPRQGRRRS